MRSSGSDYERQSWSIGTRTTLGRVHRGGRLLRSFLILFEELALEDVLLRRLSHLVLVGGHALLSISELD